MSIIVLMRTFGLHYVEDRLCDANAMPLSTSSWVYETAQRPEI